MTPQFKEKLERRREQLYAAVKANRPDLYRRAVEVGHMAMEAFGGSNELQRCARVEMSAMELAALAAGIDVPLDQQP